jgi:hypothetical protein
MSQKARHRFSRDITLCTKRIAISAKRILPRSPSQYLPLASCVTVLYMARNNADATPCLVHNNNKSTLILSFTWTLL